MMREGPRICETTGIQIADCECHAADDRINWWLVAALVGLARMEGKQ